MAEDVKECKCPVVDYVMAQDDRCGRYRGRYKGNGDDPGEDFFFYSSTKQPEPTQPTHFILILLQVSVLNLSEPSFHLLSYLHHD